jgi:DNA-binding transcriptional ArsR family regulator
MRRAEIVNDALLAIADSSRRVLLQRLAHGPATSGQLADLLPVSRPATSKHLHVLVHAGLIRTTVLGREHWHELAPSRLYEVERWITGLAETWASAPTLKRATPYRAKPTTRGARP